MICQACCLLTCKDCGYDSNFNKETKLAGHHCKISHLPMCTAHRQSMQLINCTDSNNNKHGKLFQVQYMFHKCRLSVDILNPSALVCTRQYISFKYDIDMLMSVRFSLDFLSPYFVFCLFVCRPKPNSLVINYTVQLQCHTLPFITSPKKIGNYSTSREDVMSN